MISKLTALRTVRRIVETSDGQVIPLVSGVDKADLNIIANVLATGGHRPTCAAFSVAARALDTTTVWDRVAEQLRPITRLPGVNGIYHVWSEEKTEVPVGYETRNDVFGDARVTSGTARYEERYLYPEGVYLIVLNSQDTDTVEQANALLEAAGCDDVDVMYVTTDELPEGSVRLV